jgi:hypothetical protein
MVGIRIVAALALVSLLLPSAAAGHDRIPVRWWLDAPTAAAKLRTEVKKRYRPSSLGAIRMRCVGLKPRAVRGGRNVFKHFSCCGCVRLNGFNYTFLYRVHVVGPNGTIAVGD